MIYIFTIALTLAMSYLYQKTGEYKKPKYRIDISKRRISLLIGNRSIINSILFVLMILPIVLVSGFRYGISIDYVKIYENGFYRIIQGNIGQNDFEIGYQLLVRTCAAIIEQPWFMFLVVAAITIFMFFQSAKQNSRNFFLSILLFFALGVYFDTFNGIRQYIAVALFVYAFRYVRERNFWKYTIILLIAGLFHYSAFLFIPVFWIYKININIKKWLIVIGILLLLSSQLSNLFILLMSSISKYNEYIIRSTLVQNTVFSLSGLLTSIIVSVPCILNEKDMRRTNEGKFLFNMVILGVAIASISGVIPLAERILYYFKGIYILSVPFALDFCHTKKMKRILTWGVVALLSSMTVIGMVALGWYAVWPYQSIFSK